MQVCLCLSVGVYCHKGVTNTSKGGINKHVSSRLSSSKENKYSLFPGFGSKEKQTGPSPCTGLGCHFTKTTLCLKSKSGWLLRQGFIRSSSPAQSEGIHGSFPAAFFFWKFRHLVGTVAQSYAKNIAHDTIRSCEKKKGKSDE